MKGLVFAIEELAVHDGPGLRTTVFLKGCPLRCQWCHNPEGWEMRPRRLKNPNGCLNCGACDTPCAESCFGCGNCLPRCPRGLIRVSGKWWEPEELARRVLVNEPLLREGGVTVSGGEPLMQPEFLMELLDQLKPVHRAIETSGYGRETDFRAVLTRLEMVYFDVKIADSEKHRMYTGVGNEPIRRNLDILKSSGVPFVVRIPTIAGVNDGAENMAATAGLLKGSESILGVELLPYNAYAGAKYALAGLSYEYDFQRPADETLEAARKIFLQAGIPATIR
jgi:pyruvate formate lyase activating enzyme